MAKKCYAVRKGRVPGVYRTWEECRQQISGFSGAEYKGFSTEQEAMEYLGGSTSEDTGISVSGPGAAAYVDGSYNPENGQFSCGVVFFHGGEEEHFSEFYIDEELAAMHNVAGEIKGAEMAMRLCLERGIESLTIYHDYEGIAKWCTGEWRTNREGTKAYREFYLAVRDKVAVTFQKVKGHSGDRGNELADRLAREALGLE